MAGASSRVDYGIDAPGVVRLVGAIGVAALVIWAALWRQPSFIVTAVLTLTQAGYMVWSSRIGKLRQREILLGLMTWRGDERVLDVGCGRGLLLIGAAKRLTRGGTAVGIDLWSAKDLSRNSREETLANARAEGVADHVDVSTGDMQALPFPDDSFDAIVSSLAVHNVPGHAGRVAAIRSMARVLKPGGRLLLQDIQHTQAYAEVAAAAGLTDVTRSRMYFSIFPPARIVSARKPQ